MISHRSTPETKAHIAQNRLMASVNLETGNPHTTVERQLQMLSAAVD